MDPFTPQVIRDTPLVLFSQIFCAIHRDSPGPGGGGGGDPAPFGTEPVKSMAASSPEGGAVGPAEAESPDPRYV